MARGLCIGLACLLVAAGAYSFIRRPDIAICCRFGSSDVILALTAPRGHLLLRGSLYRLTPAVPTTVVTAMSHVVYPDWRASLTSPSASLREAVSGLPPTDVQLRAPGMFFSCSQEAMSLIRMQPGPVRRLTGTIVSADYRSFSIGIHVLLLVAPLIFLTFLLTRKLRRLARSASPHLCGRCAYDLRSTPDANGPRLPVCPECGAHARA